LHPRNDVIIANFSPKVKYHLTPLHPIIYIGPFCNWGIEFMEFLPMSIDGNKYIIVFIDYFTMLKKGMLTFNNMVATITYFFFNHIITQFDVPK
jgi:hypothetical protein